MTPTTKIRPSEFALRFVHVHDWGPTTRLRSWILYVFLLSCFDAVSFHAVIGRDDDRPQSVPGALFVLAWIRTFWLVEKL